jgi:hypothetical protein
MAATLAVVTSIGIHGRDAPSDDGCERGENDLTTHAEILQEDRDGDLA